MSRANRWFLACIIILAIATTVALTRQQANFDEHKDIVDRACLLADTNRHTIHRVLVELSRTESITAATRAALASQAASLGNEHSCHD